MGRTKQSSKPGAKVVGYVRVSKEEQVLSPEGQRATLQRWCTANGYDLVAVHEEHLTGTAKRGAEVALNRRPALLAALAALEEHKAAVLLVAKRDRLSRDPILTAMIERLAARHGARVVSTAGEGTDSQDPTGILMRRMVDAFAEYEALLIAARTAAALAVKRTRGEKTGGDVPYGFFLAADGVHLVELPEEQEVIRLARELRAAGWSLRKIGAELGRRGALPRNGSAWHPQTVARLAGEVNG